MKTKSHVKVYILKVDYVKEHFNELMLYITLNRKKHLLELSNENERNACLAVGYLLHQYLGIQNDDELITGTYGKLYLKSQKKYFNISHCDDFAVLAIADKELGIDIEPVNVCEQLSTIPYTVFTNDEIKWLNSHCEKESFSILWTQKEAILKADGYGFYKDPKSFSVLDSKEFNVKSYFINNHIISCAMKNDFFVQMISC